MKQMMYVVYTPNAGAIARFREATTAQRFAQHWSSVCQTWVEVVDHHGRDGGIIGQYDRGMVTPEFHLHVRGMVGIDPAMSAT